MTVRNRSVIAIGTALTSLMGIALVALAPSAARAAAGTCDPSYPASVSTTTSLRLARSVARYGSTNVARVRVSSDAGRPSGSVTISVSGVSYTQRLHGGRVSHRLPRYLAGNHTYTVTASYAGSGCYAASSASASYTVVGRGPRVHMRHLHAANVRRGQHPRVSGRVTVSGGRVHGSVQVRLFHDGALERSRVVSATNAGRFHTGFPRVRSTGRWTAKATALAYGVRDSTTFRVRR